jgi:hypothetical protein
MRRTSITISFLASLLFLGTLTTGAAASTQPTEGMPVFRGEPGENVPWQELPAFNSRSNNRWSPLLKDIINHEAPGDSNNYDDMITIAHETSHGIHSYIRQHMHGDEQQGDRVNGFYALGGKVAVIGEPRMRKRHVAPFVPASLRGSRFATYITGQTAWDDTPLYVWDEWNAYVNGGEAGVDLVEHELWTYGWRDGVAGTIEFTVYALATAMAVQQQDPEYFVNNEAFREFLAFNIRRGMTSFKKGAVMNEFKWDTQDRYWQKLKTSADADAMRTFARALLGAEWTMEQLGF